MGSIRYLQIDAFTDRLFAGNPAAVCLLPEPLAESLMQSIAAEMNLSETAFVVADGDEFQLRWFTPVVEVALCGHATLAASHALWTEGDVDPDQAIQFRTKSGPLITRRQSHGILMDFPRQRVEAATASPELSAALGAEPTHFAVTREDAFIVVDSETTLRSLSPDFSRLARIESRGFIVTSRADSGEIDFVSRFFAPRCGIDEDPVTGSAHCSLASYWSEILGRDDLIGYQASQRGGTVRVEVRGDRVVLSGQAVTVLRGELLL